MKWNFLAMGLLSALFTVGLTSCGIGLEDSSGGNTDREIKNEKLRDEYESVRGTYEGFLRLNSQSERFPVKLYMWTGEVQEAPQPGDLKPGVRVVLRGRLMQQKFIGDSDNLILTGQFDASTGTLRLDPDAEISKTSTGCRLGGQDPITVSGSVSPDRVDGSVLRNGQEWAKLDEMKRVSSDVSTGAVLSEEQEYQRLLSTYQPVTGMYAGSLNRRVCRGGGQRAEDFSLLLYIERVQEGAGTNGTPCYVPRLTIRTLRNFSGELDDVTYRSINRFDPGRFLPQFTSTTAKLNLNFQDDVLSGDIMTSGRWGGFRVKRYSDQVEAPGDEQVLLRERLARTIGLFTGDYRGKVQPARGRSWPVKVTLYASEKESNGSRVPYLAALYQRADPNWPDETIGQRLMEVTIANDGCAPTLFMKSEPIPGSNIPGLGLMRYQSEWDDGKMSGELTDHRGPQGLMTLKRR